jgi:hypothetical protein
MLVLCWSYLVPTFYLGETSCNLSTHEEINVDVAHALTLATVLHGSRLKPYLASYGLQLVCSRLHEFFWSDLQTLSASDVLL